MEGVACLARNYLNPGRGYCCGFRNSTDQLAAARCSLRVKLDRAEVTWLHKKPGRQRLGD